MKAFCSNCRRKVELIDGKERREGNKTIITGICKSCGKPVKFVIVDLSRNV